MRHADLLSFTSDGRLYEWVGGFGAVFVSRERGRHVGECRMIGGELFYVSALYSADYIPGAFDWFSTPRVCWTQPNITPERIREIKNGILD